MRAAFLVFLLVGIFACGGNVVVDGSASTGGMTTTTGASVGSGGGGGSPCPAPCPMFPPGQGSPCACSGQACPYDQCPQDGALVTATCTGESWSLQIEMCTATACGTTQCTPGFVCLHHVGGPVTPPKCIPDPCGGAPLSCSCATSVCPVGNDLSCMASGSDLVCGCDACQ